MKARRFFSFAVLAASLGLLAACDSLRDEAGLTKQSPDEFAVTTKAPLIIPPDFNLHPPSPGAAPLNQTDPTSSAELAMFNNSDPATVAAQMQGKSFDEVHEARRRTIPAGRFGMPEEFGAACAFLCSAQAGYVTGLNFLIDGGAYPGTY